MKGMRDSSRYQLPNKLCSRVLAGPSGRSGRCRLQREEWYSAFRVAKSQGGPAGER